MTTRKARAAHTQRLAALYANQHGWPWATAVGAGTPGRDITGMPGLAPEVKGTEGLDLTGSLRQAIRNAGQDLPFVIYRPRGYGPDKIPDWPCVLRYADLVRLLRAAGYGDPEEQPRCSCGPDVTGEAPDEQPDCPQHGLEALRRSMATLPSDGEVPF